MAAQDSLAFIVPVKCSRCSNEDKPRIALQVEEQSGHAHGEYRCPVCQHANGVSFTKEQLEKLRIQRNKNVLRNASMMSELMDVDDEMADELKQLVRKTFKMPLTCRSCSADTTPFVQLNIDPRTGDGLGFSRCSVCLTVNEVFKHKAEVEQMQEILDQFTADANEKLPGETDEDLKPAPKKAELLAAPKKVEAEAKHDLKPHVSREEVERKLEQEKLTPRVKVEASSFTKLELSVDCSSCKQRQRPKLKIIEEKGKQQFETSFKCKFCLRRTNVVISEEAVREYKERFDIHKMYDPEDDEPDDLTGETGAGIVTISKIVEHVADAAEFVGKQIDELTNAVEKQPVKEEEAKLTAPLEEIKIKEDPVDTSRNGCFFFCK